MTYLPVSFIVTSQSPCIRDVFLPKVVSDDSASSSAATSTRRPSEQLQLPAASAPFRNANEGECVYHLSAHVCVCMAVPVYEGGKMNRQAGMQAGGQAGSHECMHT